MNSNQLVFHPCDSCIDQSLSIMHEINKAFGSNSDVFLNFSKNFDIVWHQRVVLSGIFSNWGES